MTSALQYGYQRLSGEVTGQKHPQLEVIANQLTEPFGTDENYAEQINPLVDITENMQDPFKFIETIIPVYRQYRDNMINFAKKGSLNPYEYANMFMYIYTQKYMDLVEMCLKYVGGRYISQNKTHFLPITQEQIIQATTLLLRLLHEFEYTPDEYAYVIYDAYYVDDRQFFNRVTPQSIYSLNVENLFNFYQLLINRILVGITTNQRNIRLLQNRDTWTFSDLLHNFTFAYVSESSSFQIKAVDGIFPEIGIVLDGGENWQEHLFKIDPLVYNRQQTWIIRLLKICNESDHLPILKETTHEILFKIKMIIEAHFLPFIRVIQDQTLLIRTPFWKQPQTKMLAHWSSIVSTLKDI